MRAKPKREVACARPAIRPLGVRGPIAEGGIGGGQERLRSETTEPRPSIKNLTGRLFDVLRLPLIARTLHRAVCPPSSFHLPRRLIAVATRANGKTSISMLIDIVSVNVSHLLVQPLRRAFRFGYPMVILSFD